MEKYVTPVRRRSAGKNHYVLVLPIPAWIRDKMNLKPGEIVEVIIRKVSLEEETPNVKNTEQK